MKRLLVIILLIGKMQASGQGNEVSLYPQDYFRNPLNIPILLAGNFGECRPNHFHSGIDIKTKGKENQPVFAAADGYISRIKMEKGGFGHALYITHPNGFMTLYAHLNNFIAPVQKHLRRTQYEKESWAVDIALKPDQFPVKKGQQIAWSGNTGASTAPHLHFEIRDSETEHPLNPMLFGLPIIDTRSPVVTQLSVYDLNQSIYNQQAQYINVRKKGDNYSPSNDTIEVNTDKPGIGINVNDYMNGSDNTLNFYTATWYLDNTPQGSIRLDDIGYEETRYLHAYVDYKSKKQNGEWYQLLFRLPGNMLTHIYPTLVNPNSTFLLKDANAHEARIELKDALGNVSEIRFYIRNTASLMAPDCSRMFTVNNPNSFDHPNIRFTLSKEDIYDNVCFQFTNKTDETGLSDRYQVHYSYVPVHKYFDLYIKPNKPVSFSDRDKVVLMYSDGKSEDGSAATFENGWYKASVRNFGTYWLTTDTKAPVISFAQKQNANLSKAKTLSITVKESVTSVRKFRAELDGKWICFEPRGNTFFYTFDEHCPKGKHTLKVVASDENDNSNSAVLNFTR